MTEENIKKILPIGSVVTLKDGNKKVMITGRIQVHKDTQKVYDYCACLCMRILSKCISWVCKMLMSEAFASLWKSD